MTKGGRFYTATFVALIGLIGWPAKRVPRSAAARLRALRHGSSSSPPRRGEGA
jgi:hypothetical protein